MDSTANFAGFRPRIGATLDPKDALQGLILDAIQPPHDAAGGFDVIERNASSLAVDDEPITPEHSSQCVDEFSMNFGIAPRVFRSAIVEQHIFHAVGKDRDRPEISLLRGQRTKIFGDALKMFLSVKISQQPDRSLPRPRRVQCR
jgi:hypothetical protein